MKIRERTRATLPSAIGALLRRLRMGERGQALWLVAGLIAVIGGMTATAIDMGSYIAERTDLQNSADAVALAASQELPDAAAAQSVAQEWATKNGIDPAEMTVQIVSQSVPSEPNPQVQVSITTEHSFTFARLIGISSAAVQVDAAAVLTSPGGSAGIVPWSVKEEVKALADPGDSVVLKYDARNGVNGNFGALAIDGTGANDYRNAIKYGSQTSICAASAPGCQDPTVDTETGSMRGPTKAGVDHRILNTSIACDAWGEVINDNGDGTHGVKAACNPFGPGGNSASMRLIVVPVIVGEFQGRSEVTITEFALFFLEGYGPGGCTGNDCEISGRFIRSNTNYGALIGTYDPNTFAHFVRLVE